MSFFEVKESFANLYSAKIDSQQAFEESKELLLTQLAYGEQVELYAKEGPWYEVGVSWQKQWDEKAQQWRGYRGWIHERYLREVEKRWTEPCDVVVKNWAYLHQEPKAEGEVLCALPLNSSLCVKRPGLDSGWYSVENGGYLFDNAFRPFSWADELDEQSWRWHLIEVGKRFISDPYLWGGTIPFDKSDREHCSSYDCSGLVYSLYRAHSLLVPRDSGCQEKYAHSLPFEKLQKADLIFFHDLENDNVYHVALYVEEDTFLEAQGAAGQVQLSSTHEQWGMSLEEALKTPLQGKTRRYRLSLGSFLPYRKEA